MVHDRTFSPVSVGACVNYVPNWVREPTGDYLEPDRGARVNRGGNARFSSIFRRWPMTSGLGKYVKEEKEGNCKAESHNKCSRSCTCSASGYSLRPTRPWKMISLDCYHMWNHVETSYSIASGERSDIKFLECTELRVFRTVLNLIQACLTLELLSRILNQTLFKCYLDWKMCHTLIDLSALT